MSALPNLTENIKRAIGLSLWSLYQIDCDLDGALYLLKTPEQSFFLNQNGDVLKVLEDGDNFVEICRVFFEGYSFPTDVKLNSISNTVCK